MEAHEGWVSFDLFQTQGESSDGTPCLFGDPPICAVSGSVKWDGCSNWDATSIHFCERDYAIQFGRVLASCWDWANEILNIES